MSLLVLKALAKLVVFDVYSACGGFPLLYDKVRECSVMDRRPSSEAVEHVCSAVDMACIWYWKQVLCLQRSAAATCLLRQFGVPAEMVIGAQQMPFKAHAWVEVDGRPVNDKSYMPETYTVLDRLSGRG